MIYTHYYEREMSVRSFTMNMGHPWPLVTHVEHFCHSGGCNCALCRVIELPLFPSTVLWNVLRAEHWNAEAGEWLMCRLHDLGVMSFTVWGVGKWWGLVSRMNETLSMTLKLHDQGFDRDGTGFKSPAAGIEPQTVVSAAQTCNDSESFM